MTAHQGGIFSEGVDHHVFLEFALDDPKGSLPTSDLVRAPIAGGDQVVAFGPALADAALPRFDTINGPGGFHAPGTQQDIFIWLHGQQRDELFARALDWRAALRPAAEIRFENHGFKFRDSRDLTGFVDGTANPKGGERYQAALTDDGGSFVLAQRWVHDLAAFGTLPVADQERVFGRTKPDSVELVGAAMPADSHVSRTDLPGAAVWRRSAPVGGARDPGLFFLAFSADVARFRLLLESMFGLTGDGLQDRMLRFTRPTSGSYYYAPPAAALLAAFGR